MRIFPLMAVVLAASFLVSGCGRSSPTSYYILDGAPSSVQDNISTRATMRVAMVNIPDYLNRNNIVSRVSGDSRLILADFHLWAEPLSNGIRRVMQALLAGMLLERHIDVIPNGSDQEADYVLELDVHRLDGNFGGNAVLAASWTLFGKNASALKGGAFYAENPVMGNSYDILVNTESGLLRTMAGEIAPRIAAAINGSSPK